MNRRAVSITGVLGLLLLASTAAPVASADSDPRYQGIGPALFGGVAFCADAVALLTIDTTASPVATLHFRFPPECATSVAEHAALAATGASVFPLTGDWSTGFTGTSGLHGIQIYPLEQDGEVFFGACYYCGHMFLSAYGTVTDLEWF